MCHCRHPSWMNCFCLCHTTTTVAVKPRKRRIPAWRAEKLREKAQITIWREHNFNNGSFSRFSNIEPLHVRLGVPHEMCEPPKIKPEPRNLNACLLCGKISSVCERKFCIHPHCSETIECTEYVHGPTERKSSVSRNNYLHELKLFGANRNVGKMSPT